jgi:hypothetical protein
MASCRRAFGTIAKRYENLWPQNKKDGFKGGIVDARRVVLQHGKMPHIRIHEIDIRGPLPESWPPSAWERIYGKEGFDPSRSRAILKNFATRAYRRPVTKDEVDRLMAVLAKRKRQGRNPREALNDALKAVLCSPAFLYLAEDNGGEKKNPQLGPHDLASRLSYFLWSSMPDYELRQKANDGSILQDEVLLAQITRMLASPRSSEFIHGFLDSWLNLRYLGEMPPDREAFATYYSRDLENAFLKETQLFTRHLLETNGPITDYLDSDYTFLNKPLAKHYDLTGAAKQFDTHPETAHQFQKVSLKGDQSARRVRGGLLGMASVLTVTANGIETSPVVRGVWLLENILGTPPNPPPDDVPPIDPDIRGATTIREQLDKHRESETCNNCHRKIDPPGFALENFDPIGAWRTNYPAGKKEGPKIDASAELPGGEPFQDIIGYKKFLLEDNRKTLFTRSLTTQLLTYATGRRLEPLDRPEATRIAAEIADKEYGMRTLIEQIVLSEMFRSR